MPETDLQTKGVPPNTCIVWAHPACINDETPDSTVGTADLYGPGFGGNLAGNTIRPSTVAAPAGHQAARFAVNTNTTGDCWYNYQLHNSGDAGVSSLKFEIEAGLLVNTTSGTGRVDLIALRTDEGDVLIRYVRGTGLVARRRTRASGDSNQTFGTQPTFAGAAHTYRVEYTASSDPDSGVQDGTLKVYMTTGSVIDKDVLGSTVSDLVEVINITHSNGPITNGFRIGWIASSLANLSNIANAGFYPRYCQFSMDEDVPSATPLRSDQPWCKAHYQMIEKADVIDDGSGGVDLTLGLVWQEWLFPGTTTRTRPGRE